MNYQTKAKRLIERDDPYIYDVAVNMFPAQIVGNVKHMKVFRDAVANQLKEDAKMSRIFSKRFLDEIKRRKKLKKVV